MRMSPRRLVCSLACAGLAAGWAGSPLAAHAATIPGAAEAVPYDGICMLFACNVNFAFAMAPPGGTLLVDWGDGTADTFTPAKPAFTTSHLYVGINATSPSWTITMSVNGGPTTTTVANCEIIVDVGVCD